MDFHLMNWKLAWALVWCLGATSAWAQTDTLVGIRKGSLELGIAGGISVPVGRYEKVATVSGSGAVLVGYHSSPQFSFGLDVGGHWHGASTDYISDFQVEPQSDHVYRFFTPYARYQFKVAKVSPYAVGLAGLYLREYKWIEFSPETVERSLTQGYVGVSGGLGIQTVTDDAMVISVEGRFHNAMRSDTTPIQFFELRVGLAFLL